MISARALRIGTRSHQIQRNSVIRLKSWRSESTFRVHGVGEAGSPPPAPPPPTGSVKILRPAIFALGISAALVYTANERDKHVQDALQSEDSRLVSWYKSLKAGDKRQANVMIRQQKKVRKWKERVDRHLKWMQSNSIPVPIQRTYLIIVNKYTSLRESKMTVLSIVAINTAVFLAWQLPPLRQAMGRNFLHNPLSGKSYTMLTSMFSQATLWHFGFNMMALYSFGTTMCDVLGRDQFLALYLSTGLTANFVSHAITSFKNPATVLPSLGASGAIYGLVSSCAYLFPDQSIYLIFVPFVTFKMAYAVPGLMGLDALGIIRGWRFFDHWAHLSGAGFGYAYMKAREMQGKRLA